MEQTEAELEKFRQQWREEVARRSQQGKSSEEKQSGLPSLSKLSKLGKGKAPPPSPTKQRSIYYDGQEDAQAHSYHDIDEKETGRKVGDDDYGTSSRQQEPKTALEHYEKAVEKEGQGVYGDSVSLYRKAFRMDDKVHESYKKKHFPPSSHTPKPTNPNPFEAPITVPNTAHHSLPDLPPTVSDLIAEFSQLSIPREPPPTSFSEPPPCPIAVIPEEVLSQILLHLAILDVASLPRVSQVCKRLAYLVTTEDYIWKRVVHGCEYGFGGMLYSYICTILGEPISESSLNEENTVFILQETPTITMTHPFTIPLSPTYPKYRQMYRQRPRIRFNGCYISTCNYNRPGGRANTVTWNSPILIVTYYRYLRFFRNGRVISLLTIAEPSDVVPHLQLEHVHKTHSGGLPQAVMKDALPGRWRLSGSPYKDNSTINPNAETSVQNEESVLTEDEPPEEEGSIFIETEGVSPKYMYKMHLRFGHAGRSTRNNKLAWQGFWSYNRISDDWAEFPRKNDKPFYWSRVRSYGSGL